MKLYKNKSQKLIFIFFLCMLFIFSNKLPAQLTNSTFNDIASNSVTHLLPQNYGINTTTSTTTQSLSSNPVKISPNTATLMQQMGSSLATQASTSLATNPQQTVSQFKASQQQMNALNYQFAAINGQFNPMQSLQGILIKQLFLWL